MGIRTRRAKKPRILSRQVVLLERAEKPSTDDLVLSKNLVQAMTFPIFSRMRYSTIGNSPIPVRITEGWSFLALRPLFLSDTKFKSDGGWPSFWDVIEDSRVKLREDLSHGMRRTEVRCGSAIRIVVTSSRMARVRRPVYATVSTRSHLISRRRVVKRILKFAGLP